MANIMTFKNAMKHGGARSNQFSVQINYPRNLFVTNSAGGSTNELGGSWDGSQANLMCRATNLPGQTLTEIPVAFRGRQIFLAGDRSFDDPWTTTFFNDADFMVRTMIERWMDEINHLDSGKGHTNPADYQGDLLVNHLDKDDKILKRYQFVSAWPTSISQIDLAAEQATEIETFDVTWRYMHFVTTAVGINGPAPTIPGTGMATDE